MPDLIEVRADEHFDEDRLAAYLSPRLEGADEPLTVRQFGGGRANLTYLLRFGRSEYVLRRPPLGPVAPGAHDMEREHRVLSRLWQVFPKAPRALLYCPDTAVIGAPFFVMERRDGVVVRETIPEVFGAGLLPSSTRALSEVVIDTLSELHSVEPTACGLGDLGRPDGFLARQLQGWVARWEAARHEESPYADEVAGWLVDSMPTSPAPTILHNDWRLDNMAVDPADPGRCLAVYDWDMATRGDPLCDLGTLLGSWHDPGDLDGRLHRLMPVGEPGWMSRGEAIDRYGRMSGRDVSDVGWYVVFGTWKMGVILQQIYIRWRRGQTRDERFSSFGVAAARLFELAAERRPA